MKKNSKKFYSYYCNNCDEELLLPYEYILFNRVIRCPYCNSILYRTDDYCILHK